MRTIESDETAARAETGVMPSPERKTILVVDDDEDVLALLGFALEEEGFSFDGAENGLAALQKVRERTPDLIILDLNMPSMGGEELLYALRAQAAMPGVPVIVITATSDALRPTDLGVEAVFAKPFDVNKLLWHIRDLLALQSPTPVDGHGGYRIGEMGNLVDDLVKVMTVLLATAEQLADAPNIPDELRALAGTGLDSAHRASALVRRLNHLVSTPE
jgi:DNA-binding response OmpR family regulator